MCSTTGPGSSSHQSAAGSRRPGLAGRRRQWHCTMDRKLGAQLRLQSTGETCGSPEVDDTGNVIGNSLRWLLGPCRRRMPLLLYYGSWEAYAKVSLAKDMSGMRYCVQGGCNLHHKHEAPHPPRCQQQRQLIDKQELMRHRESVATPAAGSHRALQSQPLTKPATNSRPENWS